MRRAAALTALVTTCALGLAACGDDQDAASPDTSPLVSSHRGATAKVDGDPATEPLTGLPVAKGEEDAVRDRPVLVLKMDNTSSSAPQLGLSSADLVVEELVEGGYTRLAAFYYSQVPGKVGPVRSMRASDIGIVSSLGATMVTSGAAAVTIKRLRGAGVDYVTEGSPGFFRDSSRYAPYDLMTTLTDVAAALRRPAERPVDYLPFGPEGDFPQGPRAASIDADFGSHTTSWSYDPTSGYVNENTYAADGDHFPADTVLVLRVEVGDAGYKDPAGNPVPETELEGTGDALVFHAGRVVEGTWSKSALDAPIRLATASGAKLDVPAGHTWIELVPAVNGDVTYSR